MTFVTRLHITRRSKVYKSNLERIIMESKDYAHLIKKPVLLTFSGSPGSGKSTSAKLVQQLLRAERIYVGDIRRRMAAAKGMTLEAFNEYALTDPSTDVDVDRDTAAEARRLYTCGKNVLVEGRTQFHFLPESIKFYIFVNEEEGARRIMKELEEKGHEGRNEKPVGGLDEMIAKINKREKNDSERYLKYYGIDHRNLTHYDYVVDSFKKSKEVVVLEVMRKIYESQQNRKI